MTEKHTCCWRIYTNNWLSGNPCPRNGKYEHNGRWYCWQHDPERIKARKAAKREMWEREYAERKAKEEARQAESRVKVETIITEIVERFGQLHSGQIGICSRKQLEDAGLLRL